MPTFDPRYIAEYSTFRTVDIPALGGTQRMLGSDLNWFDTTPDVGFANCTSARIKDASGEWKYLQNSGEYLMRTKVMSKDDEAVGKSTWIDVARVGSAPADESRLNYGYGPSGALVTTSNSIYWPYIYKVNQWNTASGFTFQAPGLAASGAQEEGEQPERIPTCFAVTPGSSSGKLAWKWPVTGDLVTGWDFCGARLALDASLLVVPSSTPLIKYRVNVGGVVSDFFTLWLDPDLHVRFVDGSGATVRSPQSVGAYADYFSEVYVLADFKLYPSGRLEGTAYLAPSQAYDYDFSESWIHTFDYNNPSPEPLHVPSVVEIAYFEYSSQGYSARMGWCEGFSRQGYVS